MVDKIITINELSEMTCISTNTLRIYLSHYKLQKFRTATKNKRNHRCTGYVVNNEFKIAFSEYIETVRGLSFKKRTFELIDDYEKYYKRGDNE